MIKETKNRRKEMSSGGEKKKYVVTKWLRFTVVERSFQSGMIDSNMHKVLPKWHVQHDIFMMTCMLRRWPWTCSTLK